MKKISSAVFLFGFCVFFAAAKPGDTVYVTVEKASIKDSRGFFAKTVAEAVYGQALTVRAEKDGWTQISVNEIPVTGWLPSSSLTSKKIVTRRGQTVSASTDELALAGKGFNKEVEDTYRQNKKINYAAVDAMEAFTLDQKELAAFITEGSLKGVRQ